MTTAHHGKAFHGGEHYENFPVGSWLVPARMRDAVLALYQFARTGDDLADEGQHDAATRRDALQTLLLGLTQTPTPPRLGHLVQPEHSPVFEGSGLPGAEALLAIGQRLRCALDRHGVGTQEAADLISAFVQDTANPRLQNEAEVLDYCRRSANPVGRMVLALAGLTHTPERSLEYGVASDAICTGLQLANFAQDMGQDVARDRIYVPQSWPQQDPTARVQQMALWAKKKLLEGGHLPAMIRHSGVASRYRLALEIALCVEGGLEICRQVLARPQAVWTASPSISKSRLIVVLLRSIRRVFMSLAH